MCTVTFIARRNGYLLGMNRDEQRCRAPAFSPEKRLVGHRNALFPYESSGGTWIGVNDSGVTFALINWYGVTARVAGESVSRGQVVRSALALDAIDQVSAGLTSDRLQRVNPFRLIAVFPKHEDVVEWAWNRERLQHTHHPWKTATWISSGFDEPGAQKTRSVVYNDALLQPSAGTQDWLRLLHASHAPHAGPYSHCMHREEAATVSYTEVEVTTQQILMGYAQGSPCHSFASGGSHLQTLGMNRRDASRVGINTPRPSSLPPHQSRPPHCERRRNCRD